MDFIISILSICCAICFSINSGRLMTVGFSIGVIADVSWFYASNVYGMIELYFMHSATIGINVYGLLRHSGSLIQLRPATHVIIASLPTVISIALLPSTLNNELIATKELLACLMVVFGMIWISLGIKSSKYAFIVMLIGNLLWLSVGISTGVVAVVAASICYTLTSVLGIYRWVVNDEQSKPALTQTTELGLRNY